jgi:hypothetical protein
MESPFKVGELYQNRLGLYEVVRLDEADDRMLIRYTENGEEVETSISLQGRIWRNMNWEDEEETRKKAREEARHQHGYGVDFSGLADSDFKTNTEGTTWRSRRGLAGRVAHLLSPNTGSTFVSWAIYRWPVAFLTHREDYFMAAFELGSRKAKFTIEVDDWGLYCGLYVEGNSGAMDATWDWTRLLPRLRNQQSLRDVIQVAESGYNVRFIARTSVGQETHHFTDGLTKSARPLWDENNPASIPVEERVRLLGEIPAFHWCELYLMTTIPRQEAVQNGVNIAHRITDVMRVLLPIYTAAIRE